LILKIEVAKLFKSCSTRQEGAVARKVLTELLNEHDSLELDFTNANMSVSFADECIGMLAENIGKEAFKKRLSFKNASPPMKALLLHVVARRLS
jgi:STAS-like domain of unknown function (DUF4325)